MDNQKIQCGNYMDKEGNPAGGEVKGIGVYIQWQNGPLGRGPDRKEPNGAFVETVIRAAKQRIEFYQSSKFKCDDNAAALALLEDALAVLHKRTADREKRAVEGVNKV